MQRWTPQRIWGESHIPASGTERSKPQRGLMDPAWCLYDLLISTRYGAGIPESTLDKYDFFSVSQYCNALVDDGKGGEERVLASTC